MAIGEMLAGEQHWYNRYVCFDAKKAGRKWKDYEDTVDSYGRICALNGAWHISLFRKTRQIETTASTPSLPCPHSRALADQTLHCGYQ